MTLQGKNIRMGTAWYFVTVLAVYLADQFSKSIAAKAMAEGDSIPIAGNIFHLTLVHNTGAAFGILKNHPYFFVAAALLFSAVIIYFLLSRKLVPDPRERIALSLILGGTLGNLSDRIRLGYVIDFFDFRVWPVFNIADSCITIGAAMLAFFLIMGSRRKKCTE